VPALIFLQYVLVHHPAQNLCTSFLLPLFFQRWATKFRSHTILN
jgi:hypothetical protein